MSPTIPWGAGHWAAAGRCGCGALVSPDSFRDRASWRDFRITGLCQSCQDDVYLRASDADPRGRHPIRRGVLAATVERDGVVVELGVLPFLCVIPEGRIAWEARFVLRAGASLAPLDPWDELRVLRPVLKTHQVRLTEVDDVCGPEVRAALDVDVAVVRDAAARVRLARLALGASALGVALADDLPWRALAGAPLPALLARWSGEAESGASVLRACALLALALEPPGERALDPLRLLLGAHRSRFPELARVPPETR